MAPSHRDQRVTFAFLQTDRMQQHRGSALTFTQASALVQEIFTGPLLVSRPGYMHWMKQADQRFRQLRLSHNRNTFTS
jgi:hypothetical protein